MLYVLLTKNSVLSGSIETVNTQDVLHIYLISDLSLFVPTSDVHLCSRRNNVLWTYSQSINSFIEKLSCYFNPSSEIFRKKITINICFIFIIIHHSL